MKYRILLIGLIFSTLLLLSVTGNKNKYKTFSGRKYAQINDTLYAATYEVTNLDYKNFLSQLNEKDYALCKIDSAEWVSKLEGWHNEPMTKHYHTHPAFNSYPVVNISWYGASKYCASLTSKYNKGLKKEKVIFRLPSEAEWNLAAHANPETKLPYTNLMGKNPSGIYLQNVGRITNDTLSFGQDGGFYTVLVSSYPPNNFGLYNIIGNAAEMINIDGIEKGGSWFDTLHVCGINRQQYYSSPDPRVGFRVFAVVQKGK